MVVGGEQRSLKPPAPGVTPRPGLQYLFHFPLNSGILSPALLETDVTLEFSTQQALAAIAALLLPLFGFLLGFAWNRWWRRKDQRTDEAKSVVSEHGDRLVVIERRLDAADGREEHRQESIGQLKNEHSILAGKVVGLQDFWRNEFNSLRRELRDDASKLRDELRQDQANMENRLSQQLSGHQQRVHDRLNIIAADQAKMLNEFIDQLLEKRTKPEAVDG